MIIILRPLAHIVLSALLACVWMLWTEVAHAYPIEKIPGGEVPAGDFVVGPTKTDLILDPGTERNIELLVTNRLGERRVFHLSTEDMKGSDDPAQTVVLLGNDRGPYSLRDYLKFPEVSFELESGERARIPVTVSVPKDAPPGGLYGSVLVTTTSVPPKDGDTGKAGAKAGSVIVSRIGSLFFITVPGAANKNGELTKFTTMPEGKKMFAQGPIPFQILFKNTGSVHLNPSGVISIKNLFGKEVGVVTADPWFAMPQSTRRRELTWDRPYLFGYYTAEAKISRGYDNQTDTATTSFLVVPWKLLALAFAALAAVFFVLRFIARTFEIKKK